MLNLSLAKKEAVLVGIVLGSASDVETMRVTRQVLEEFGIGSEMRILSAHRSPEELIQWVKGAKQTGTKVIIAAAGVAAHLAGVVAAHTVLPVIGVPMGGGALQGVDALLSTVQMPRGTPVATVAIGPAGATNAALLALRILALQDPVLEAKLLEYQKRLSAEALNADRELQKHN